MQLEEYFLGATANKPIPSVSGEDGPKHIIIFHCEFSAKRAPTLYARFRVLDSLMSIHSLYASLSAQSTYVPRIVP